jgi:DNA-binding helix-hairpin-helix protein with protein kinase domain
LRRQQQRFLSRFRIADATFEQLSTEQIARLAIHGITTAADIERDRERLPHLVDGPAVLELLTWYRAHGRKFQFDPHEPEDARELAHIDELINTRQEQLLARLREGPALLQRKREEIAAAQERLRPTVQRAYRALQRTGGRSGLSE